MAAWSEFKAPATPIPSTFSYQSKGMIVMHSTTMISVIGEIFSVQKTAPRRRYREAAARLVKAVSPS